MNLSASLLRVLLVEDDEELAALLRIQVVAGLTDGVDVEVASNLADARARLMQTEPVDVVLLDLGLPDADRRDDLSALRVLAALPKAPPIVVLTGLGPELGPGAIRAGAQDYVDKVTLAHPDELLRCVRYAIERHHRSARIERQHALLVRANEQLQQFAGAVAHDIKRPITAASLGLRTVLRPQVGEDTEQRERLLRVCVSALGRLDQQLDQLVSEVAQTLEHDRSEVDLRDVMAWVVDTLADQERQRLRLVIEADTTLWGRVGGLRQIAYNLVLNALRHNPDHRVTVRVALEREPGGVVLVFEDDGIGIPAHLRSKVRLPGWRGTGHGVAGLGLSTVELRAETMGGSLEVRDSSLGGAGFRIVLPQRGRDRQVLAHSG